MNSKIILSGLSIVTAMALMAGGSFAYFTSTDTSSNNSFATGTVKINILEDAQGYIPFNVTGMVPGDSKTQCAAVSNDGTLSFNWHFNLIEVTPTTTPDLNDVLNAKIEKWTGASAPSTTDCTDTSVTTNWSPIFDNNVSLATNPDKMGQLDSGKQAYFRITAYLPTDLKKAGNVDVTDNDYQGASAAYQFKVDAYQLGDTDY